MLIIGDSLIYRDILRQDFKSLASPELAFAPAFAA